MQGSMPAKIFHNQLIHIDNQLIHGGFDVGFAIRPQRHSAGLASPPRPARYVGRNARNVAGRCYVTILHH